MRLPKKTTDENENSQFTQQFAKVTAERQDQEPWAYEQPLKPRPKVFSVNDPDMMGG